MSSNAYYPNPIGNIEINEEKYFDLISDINLKIGNIDGLLEYNDYEKIYLKEGKFFHLKIRE